MSSWIDRIAIQNTLKLRDEFNIKIFVETGTFYGVGAELYSHYFKDVFTCECDKKYYDIALDRLKKYNVNNVSIVFDKSFNALRRINGIHRESIDNPTVFFFLDAHDKNELWTVEKELRALKGFHNCIIAIHDFDCSGLGHLIYDGKHCDWNVIKDAIKEVNESFHYYCNDKSSCDIQNEYTIIDYPIKKDKYVIDMIQHANRSEDKKYRGILYAIPAELDLTQYKLREFKPND